MWKHRLCDSLLPQRARWRPHHDRTLPEFCPLATFFRIYSYHTRKAIKKRSLRCTSTLPLHNTDCHTLDVRVLGNGNEQLSVLCCIVKEMSKASAHPSDHTLLPSVCGPSFQQWAALAASADAAPLQGVSFKFAVPQGEDLKFGGPRGDVYVESCMQAMGSAALRSVEDLSAEHTFCVMTLSMHMDSLHPILRRALPLSQLSYSSRVSLTLGCT